MSKKSKQKVHTERRVARLMDYASVGVCLAGGAWFQNEWWFVAAAVCLVLAIANPGEWLRRRIVSRLFRAAGQR